MKQKNENKKRNTNIEITSAVPNRAHTAMKSQSGMKSNQQGQNNQNTSSAQSNQNNTAKSSGGQSCK